METKVCTKCGEEKDVSFFPKRQRRCKACTKIYLAEYCKNNVERIKNRVKEYYEENKEYISKNIKKYTEENKEKIQERNKKWREDNKEKINKQRKEYRDNNKELISKQKKKYAENNKDLIKERSKRYAEENKEEIKKRSKEQYKKDIEKHREQNKVRNKRYREKNKANIKERTKKWVENNRENLRETAKLMRIRRKDDISFRITGCLRARIRVAIKKGKGYKSEKTQELLGCDFETVKKHLEEQFKEGMSWENHGKNGWHIDHIIPCASFDLTDPEEQRKCFHYTNLQPLWAKDNLEKGDKIILDEREM